MIDRAALYRQAGLHAKAIAQAIAWRAGMMGHSVRIDGTALRLPRSAMDAEYRTPWVIAAIKGGGHGSP